MHSAKRRIFQQANEQLCKLTILIKLIEEQMRFEDENIRILLYEEMYITWKIMTKY